MKKILLNTFVVFFIMILSNLAFALDNGTINVDLQGTKEIAPNAFELKFVVETKNTDAKKAMNENRISSESLYNALKTMINSSRGDYIKTTNYSVVPNYEYNSKGKSTLKGYTVNNSVIVYVKDINVVSKFIDKASEHGITQIDNLSFKSSGYESECDALLADLSLKAQKRANKILSPLNMQILTVKTINTACSASSPRTYFRTNKALLSASAESADGASTPIEAGVTTLNANLNLTFYIKPKTK